MMLNYSKTERANKTVEVLNDLLKINNDRIAGYERAILQIAGSDKILAQDFKNIIKESLEYQKQLIGWINSMEGNPRKGVTIMGKIYGLWSDLKVTFASSAAKVIISNCQYNEEIALHAYGIALNLGEELSAEVRATIKEQEQALRRTLEQISRHRDMRHIAGYNLMYFN